MLETDGSKRTGREPRCQGIIDHARTHRAEESTRTRRPAADPAPGTGGRALRIRVIKQPAPTARGAQIQSAT